MEFIYLIREREFVYSNQNIYKIGRTNNSIKIRMNNYPKDSEILLIEPVINSIEIENQLIKIFDEEFSKAYTKDGLEIIGNEYYQGDLNKMIYLIRTYIKNHCSDKILI